MSNEQDYKATLEKIRTELLGIFPEQYLTTAPDSNFAAWIFREVDAVLDAHRLPSEARETRRSIDDPPAV